MAEKRFAYNALIDFHLCSFLLKVSISSRLSLLKALGDHYGSLRFVSAGSMINRIEGHIKCPSFVRSNQENQDSVLEYQIVLAILQYLVVLVQSSRRSFSNCTNLTQM